MRAFVRGLHLLDQTEWYAYSRGDLERLLGRRPPDIPACPFRDYRGRGWQGMRDWLGPPPLDPVVPGFAQFKLAREFARGLGLRTQAQWRAWCAGGRPSHRARPANVPADPVAVYPHAWRGWDDWLGVPGTSLRASRFRPFTEARAFARSLRLSDVHAWRAYVTGRDPGKGGVPEDIPSNPDNVYLGVGWRGYGDWLGTAGRAVRRSLFVPYDEAAAFVRALGLRNEDEFRAWVRGEAADLPPRPRTIPTNPNRTYRGRRWTTWGVFFGTRAAPPACRTLAETQAFVRSLGIRTASEWRRYTQGRRPDIGTRPEDVPASPDVAYRGRGWISWGAFLGTGAPSSRRRAWRGPAETQAFARSIGLGTVTDWVAWTRGLRPDLPPRPADIPANPDRVFRDRRWPGWTAFLRGTARK